MKSADVIRAWKNEEYRLSLSEAERALLPVHPAGAVELTDAELGGAAAGGLIGTWWRCTWMGCSWCPFTWCVSQTTLSPAEKGGFRWL
jgi:mersacidin/lichenicidin family type 2 lantibiotic